MFASPVSDGGLWWIASCSQSGDVTFDLVTSDWLCTSSCAAGRRQLEAKPGIMTCGCLVVVWISGYLWNPMHLAPLEMESYIFLHNIFIDATCVQFTKTNCSWICWLYFGESCESIFDPHCRWIWKWVGAMNGGNAKLINSSTQSNSV